MSVPVNGVVRRNGGGRLPDGTEVASYGSYEEALAALEVLASNVSKSNRSASLEPTCIR